MKSVLTIAGSDCSGGAGIQADLKTITMHGLYGMSVITSLTAQNTLGVSGIFPVDKEFVLQQLQAVFEDIRPDAVKTGMLFSSEIICAVVESLKNYKAQNIVVDPVMVSTSGSRLLADDALECVKNTLLPLAKVITPNIPEAEVLAERKIRSAWDMEEAAKTLYEKYGCAVLCKGGHATAQADDFLFFQGQGLWLKNQKIANPNTHGTGCTLSSALACNLAKGLSLEDSCAKAKAYVFGAINAFLSLGKGRGPLHHGYLLDEKL